MHNPDLLGRIKKKNEWKWTEDLRNKMSMPADRFDAKSKLRGLTQNVLFGGEERKTCPGEKVSNEQRILWRKVKRKLNWEQKWVWVRTERWRRRMNVRAAVFNLQGWMFTCVKGRDLFGSEKEFESVGLSLRRKFRGTFDSNKLKRTALVTMLWHWRLLP